MSEQLNIWLKSQEFVYNKSILAVKEDPSIIQNGLTKSGKSFIEELADQKIEAFLINNPGNHWSYFYIDKLVSFLESNGYDLNFNLYTGSVFNKIISSQTINKKNIFFGSHDLSAVHICAIFNHYNLLMDLIKNGHLVNIKNKFDKSTLDYMKELNDIKMIDFLNISQS